MIRDNDPSFKLIGLVVSVCLTVFLISSCSDNNTESGMELGLAGADVEPTAADNFNVEGSIHNRSASCNLVFSGTKYVDHKLHKVLANCDSVNKVYAYHGRTESTVTLTQWFKDWCTSQHGSSTTIIDADEQQCSSGSGTYNVAAVGYVNKYSDLLRVYNARGGGQSKSLWGKNHYCNSGRSEGRNYSGLSSASCNSTTSTTTTSSNAFEGYVNKYSDLLRVYNARGRGQTKSAWGKNHYCNNGRIEGRTYPGLSASSCGSTTTTSTTTTTTTSSNAFEGYVNKYSDLLRVYNARGRGQTKSAWGKNHYCNNGRIEGRTYPGLSASSCGSTTTTTTTTTTSGWPSGDYNYLCKHNECTKFSNRTRRWPSTTIQVSGASRTEWREGARRWPTVSFSFVGSAPAQGIQIMGYSSKYRNWCGWAVPYMYSSGEYAKCEIYVHSDINNMNCTHADLMEHEIGHCIGFLRHTDDKTVMNKYVGAGPRTSAVTNMIRLLYSLSPGTNISSKLTNNYSRFPKSSIEYEKNGRKLIPLGIYFTEEIK